MAHEDLMVCLFLWFVVGVDFYCQSLVVGFELKYLAPLLFPLPHLRRCNVFVFPCAGVFKVGGYVQWVFFKRDHS